MQSNCFFCHLRMLEKQIEKFNPEEIIRQQLIGEFIENFKVLSKENNPVVAQKLHALIRKHLKEPDPYKKEKSEGNAQAEKLADQWRIKLQTRTNNIFEAFKLALAANIIDFGPGHNFDINDDIERIRKIPLSINHSDELISLINKSKNLFYITDNAGEIVFDKLLMEQLTIPEINIGVRGKPIINDATMEDALKIGLAKIGKIIPNGNDAPSTLLDQCSTAFITAFNKADVIIAKGMGNIEGLMHLNDSRLFFILVVKCDAIGKLIGKKTGDTVIVNSTYLHRNQNILEN